MSFVVAIDGTAGSGKGTVTKKIAEHIGLVNIDTGATYRCVTLEMLNRGIGLEETEKIEKMLEEISIEIKNENGKQTFFLNGEDVTEKIRTKEVDALVSQVSHVPIVRSTMVDLQRKMAEGKEVIIEGRDVGTNVFPNADVKIYMDATPEERANRRLKQNQEKGIEGSYEELLANVLMRDNNDKTSNVAPLKQAEDAIYIDTTNLTIEEVQVKIEELIEKKKKHLAKPENVEKKEAIEKKKKESFGKKAWRAIIKYVLLFLYKIVYRVKVEGQEKMPQEGAFILCGNHVSYIKVPVIVLFTKRKVNFIAKAELFKNPILNWLGYLFDVIPVKRGKQDVDSMKKSLTVLKNGEVLGLFPEGTRNGLEKKVKVKTGAAYMALRAGVPVVPVGIKVTKKPFPKIILNYGEALNFGKDKMPEKEKLEQVTKTIMDDIIRLTNEAV